MKNHWVRAALCVGLGVVTFGGTCSEPPPYHDLSGGWVCGSWGAAKVALEGAGQGDPVDIDVGLALSSAVPRGRSPERVTGTVCVVEHAGLGLAGTYTLDPAASLWAGSDYGAARLDLVARAPDGRHVSISQAFMPNASPDHLENAILVFATSSGSPAGTIRFEGFDRRAGPVCAN